MTTAFSHAILGQWGLLDRTEPEPLARPQRIAHLASPARTLIVGALPFLAVMSIQQSPMAMEGSVVNYLKAGTILWGLVTILSLLDSNYAARIAAIKDLSSLLPSVGDKDGTKQ